EGLNRSLRKDQRAAAKNVIDVDALNRQHVDVRNVGCSALEAGVDFGATDYQCVGKAKLCQVIDQNLGLGVLQKQVVNDDQVLCLCLGGESVTQAKRPHLLRQLVLMATSNRPVCLTTTAELRCASGRVTSAAGALLAVHLCTGTSNFRTALRLVRALLALCKLPANDAVKDVLAWIQTKNLLGDLQLSGILTRKGCYLKIHYSAPSLAAASSALTALLLPATRIAPGTGASLGSGALTASLTMIQPPAGPGMAPRTKIRPRSVSVETISRFWVVTRVAPMWPAIFLPLKTLPGSWR